MAKQVVKGVRPYGDRQPAATRYHEFGSNAKAVSEVAANVNQEVSMGRTTEKVTVKNYVDVFSAASGALDPARVRTADVLGIVDTGAAYLCLPPSVIAQLGLLYSHTDRVRTANGAVQRRIFNGAEIWIRERNIQMAVMENDEDTPPLIGYLILEALDYVVDPKTQKITGNPEHDGEWITDLY